MSYDAMTKNELIKELKGLKEELIELRELKEQVGPSIEGLTESAVSVISGEGGVATVVKLKFNPQTRVAVVEEFLPFPGATHMAMYKANEILNADIINKRK